VTSDGVHEISTASAREVLRAIENEERGLDHILLKSDFCSREIMRLDRGRHVGVHRIADSFLGYLTLAIDLDYRVHIAEKTEFRLPKSRAPPAIMPSAQPSSFNLTPMKLPASLETGLSRQRMLYFQNQWHVSDPIFIVIKGLSSPDCLQSFVADSAAMCERINAIRSVRCTLLQRLNFGEKFTAMQAA
jgi:hypothetical protein